MKVISKVLETDDKTIFSYHLKSLNKKSKKYVNEVQPSRIATLWFNL